VIELSRYVFEALRPLWRICALQLQRTQHEPSIGEYRTHGAWSLEPVPVHVIYSAQRMLPASVRAFVDFATAFAKTELDAASL
jgi:hypothetical protein